MKVCWGIINSALLVALVASPIGCKQKTFSGDGKKDKEDRAGADTRNDLNPFGNNYDPNNPNGQNPNAGNNIDASNGLNNPTGTLGGNGGSEFLPQVCSLQANTIRFARNSQCPMGSAAYAADDSDAAKFACCPVPIRDMLVGQPVLASNTCPVGSVVVGAQNNQLWCRQLNPQYARPTQAQPTCYYGSGASGGDGSRGCGAPPLTIQAMTTQFGSDACLPFPFGGLIVGRRGDDCTDVIFVNIMDPRTGQPLQMFR